MEIIYFFIAVFSGIYALFAFSSIMVQWPKYKYYKPTYDAIQLGTYVFASTSESYDTFRPKDKVAEWWSDDEILFFHDKWTGKRESIKLLGKTKYIHAGLSNVFDPYTAYWFHKLHSLARTKMTTPSIETMPDVNHELIKDKTKS
jgi:hypothetical protein